MKNNCLWTTSFTRMIDKFKCLEKGPQTDILVVDFKEYYGRDNKYQNPNYLILDKAFHLSLATAQAPLSPKAWDLQVPASNVVGGSEGQVLPQPSKTTLTMSKVSSKSMLPFLLAPCPLWYGTSTWLSRRTLRHCHVWMSRPGLPLPDYHYFQQGEFWVVIMVRMTCFLPFWTLWLFTCFGD